MFINSKKITILYGALLMLLLLFVGYKELFTSQEIAYVDNQKLFDEFNMTKEMKRIGEKEFNMRKKELDSLYVIIQSDGLPESDKETLTKTFIEKRENFEAFNQTFAQQESAKIWKRINGYVAEFGNDNNYKIIIGSETKRDVLFAKESINITPDLITYINKKYEGLK